MSRRSTVVARKTLRDFSSPKLLVAFLGIYVGLCALFAHGAADGMPDDLSALPLHTQEAALVREFVVLTFLWGVGIPMMVLVAVLAAVGIAAESERGTLEILLSKPIRPWEVLAGKFAAITLFSVLAMLSGALIVAALLVGLSGASAGAVRGSVWHVLPGTLAYALFVSVVVGALGTLLAVVTRSRLQTALGVLAVPALFFGAFIVRVLVPDAYEDYALYLVDVNYHFGNAFVLIHEAAGAGLLPTTQFGLDLVSGVYDAEGSVQDPLVGGMATSLPYAGYVPPAVSLLGLVALSIGLLALATYRFERMDLR